MGSLSGNVAIVTGAGSGLGKETVHRLVRDGVNVVACSRTPAKVETLEQELKHVADRVHITQADISVPEDVTRLTQDTLSRFGRIDILINNAATFQNALLADLPLSSWNEQIENNITGAFLMIQSSLPVMRKQQSGIVINFTSSLAEAGGAGFGAYGATKAALETLTHTLNEEEYTHGVRAHVINPGIMQTNMQAMGEDPGDVAEKLLRFIQQDRETSGQVIDLSRPGIEYHI